MCFVFFLDTDGRGTCCGIMIFIIFLLYLYQFWAQIENLLSFFCFVFFCTASTEHFWYSPWTWVRTVLSSVETILITAKVLRLIINNLCYQTRMVCTVSRLGSQGFDHEGFSESYFPKLYIHSQPYHILMKVIFLVLSRISETLRKEKKNTWSSQSIRFYSIIIYYKTVKIFVLQGAACGLYKKNAVWALQWIAEVPKVICIWCWEPRSNSDLSTWNWIFLQ